MTKIVQGEVEKVCHAEDRARASLIGGGVDRAANWLRFAPRPPFARAFLAATSLSDLG